MYSLLQMTGEFSGVGINHADESFTGRMTLNPVTGNRAVSLIFTALGDTGEVFHDERTLIGFDPAGELVMVSVSNNTGAVMQYHLHHREKGQLVFQFGDAALEHTFRERREMIVHDNGDVTYRFSWGAPGEPFQEQSVVRMMQTPG